jgi:uncharacterized protein YbcV (DUF1398 family)
MTREFREAAAEATAASDGGRISFPEVVAMLAAAGVERYHADLVRAERVFYRPDGESVTVGAHALTAPPAMDFSGQGVMAAIGASQQGKIQYREFCARIAASGCVAYLVSLAGRRAVYYGRTGETHVEYFPGSRP